MGSEIDLCTDENPSGLHRTVYVSRSSTRSLVRVFLIAVEYVLYSGIQFQGHSGSKVEVVAQLEVYIGEGLSLDELGMTFGQTFELLTIHFKVERSVRSYVFCGNIAFIGFVYDIHFARECTGEIDGEVLGRTYRSNEIAVQIRSTYIVFHRDLGLSRCFVRFYCGIDAAVAASLPCTAELEVERFVVGDSSRFTPYTFDTPSLSL